MLAAAVGTVQRFQIGQSGLLCLHLDCVHALVGGACSL